ncbi:protein G12-like [Battus philenor]|uniref:protein G12-like n=1 Tax=Battus philenor TaxID=42288 RepID=UPI0035D0100E
MKVAIILLSIVSLSFSAPQPRKIFHEHAEDFLELIMQESNDEIMQIFESYLEFEEFTKSLDYMTTSDFKQLVYEMESLPEFKAVVDFLENDNIDILYFIDRLNEIIEEIQEVKRTRQEISGKDMTAYINDCIAVFPKDKLVALFEEKVAEDEEFRVAIENLQSDEWDQIWNALWENETFLEEANILLENGIDLQVLLVELKAVFGQF